MLLPKVQPELPVFVFVYCAHLANKIVQGAQVHFIPESVGQNEETQASGTFGRILNAETGQRIC